VPDAFYIPKGPLYDSTELTRGPWDPGSQHAGPPCALLGAEMDRAGKLDPARVARVTFEILRPVPIAPLSVKARVVRPGRSVELVEGSLSAGDTEILRARAWRVRTTEMQLDGPSLPDERMAPPSEAQTQDFFPTGQDVGYQTAMEVRFVSGSYLKPGPARAWMRMRGSLVEGEEVSPLDRVLVAADSGNGVSASLDYRRWLFINADLSVALQRLPRGEWVGLDAATYAEPDGIGLSDTRLHDEHGAIGRATQSLLVGERPGPTPPG